MGKAGNMTISVTPTVTSPLYKGGNVTLRLVLRCYGECYGEWRKATGNRHVTVLRKMLRHDVTANVTLIMSTVNQGAIQ